MNTIKRLNGAHIDRLFHEEYPGVILRYEFGFGSEQWFPDPVGFYVDALRDIETEYYRLLFTKSTIRHYGRWPSVRCYHSCEEQSEESIFSQMMNTIHHHFTLLSDDCASQLFDSLYKENDDSDWFDDNIYLTNCFGILAGEPYESSPCMGYSEEDELTVYYPCALSQTGAPIETVIGQKFLDAWYTDRSRSKRKR